MYVVGNSHPQAPAQRSRRDNRTAILRAGLVLFSRHGVAGVTFEDIAGETGLTRRTIYNHFANVDDLFAGSIKWALEELSAQLPPAIPAERPLDLALDRYVRDLLSLFTSPRFAEVQLALVRHDTDRPVLRAAFDHMLVDPLYDRFATYLYARRLREDGSDPHRIAREIVAVVLGLAEAARLLGRSAEETLRDARSPAVMIARTLATPKRTPLVQVA
ncbi:TetR/AcrR family transcriptional regulator [Sphingomonas sp. R-74633]|uniref:TetR/AcrR family transcriptional regulator n=1 Tax=Sphingomonas sp. R-74633 TaxID=2751188 RepID=UPI0015D3C3F4|nr:TetR/AcrR family transcriptional regulator [Sphingomonas sp. R-74633]NYT41977.1 TetR/AcrR family transcriptional regulator [Sphingomonas sp. R-74633]